MGISFQDGVVEKDFYNDRYTVKYGYIKLSDGSYIVKSQQEDNTFDLLLVQGEKIVSRLCNYIPSNSTPAEVINGKTYIHACKIFGETTLQNRICADELQNFLEQPSWFESVTEMIHLYPNVSARDNQIAYYLTDQWFPQWFLDWFWDLGEDFNDLMEDGIHISKDDIIALLVEQNGKYRKQLGLFRIDNQGMIPIEWKLKKRKNVDFFHESLLLIQRWKKNQWGGDFLYSMRSGKTLLELVKDFDIETTGGERASLVINAEVEWDSIKQITCDYI
jgi:hypothetical protein